MKKYLVSIFLSAFMALGAFAQPSVPTIPVPYVMVPMEYGAPNGHEVTFSVAYNPAGISYVVVDPQTSAADQQGILNLVQNQANFITGGSRAILLSTIPNQVNNGSNIFNARTTAPWAVTGNQVLTSIPGLQVNLDSTQNYFFRAVLYVQCGAGGSKIDFGGTAVPVAGSVVAQVTAIGGTSIIYASQATSFLSGPGGSNSTATTQIIIEGYFQTNVGGTFVIQFCQNSSNAAASTVLQGSSLTLTSVP